MFENCFSVEELIAERARLIQQFAGNRDKLIEINQEFMAVKASLQTSSYEMDMPSEVELQPVNVKVNVDINPNKVGAEYKDGILYIHNPRSMYAVQAMDTKGLPQITNSFTIVVDTVPKFSIK